MGGVGLGSLGWVGCVALGPVTPHWTPLVLVGTPTGIQGSENRIKHKLATLRVDILVPFPPSVRPTPETLNPSKGHWQPPSHIQVSNTGAPLAGNFAMPTM